MSNKKAKAIQQAKDIVKSLERGDVRVEFKEIPYLKALIEGIEKYTFRGTSIIWSLSKGLYKGYRLDLTLIVNRFYIDKPSGDVFFHYNRHNGIKENFLWVVANPNEPTKKFVPWDDTYSPCRLMDLKPLIPHIHTNIKKQSALFSTPHYPFLLRSFSMIKMFNDKQKLSDRLGTMEADFLEIQING